MKTELIPDCQVEWDKARGVLYVHNTRTGATIIRIGGLPRTKARLDTGQIDIAVSYGLVAIAMPDGEVEELRLQKFGRDKAAVWRAKRNEPKEPHGS